ncbi:unnamed protein product [Vitrella brassicaformis CCMP3155]|uniref:endo-1,4-beta-xylanase n=2 Tax=Vitrella brassicaformis TaxID=1169539 RepID=A0A0G4ES82_VITBC|nr:unnamed protein product [Vitrella brassicaformis CCMP3155]|mmetsp:Transcript_24396/g.60216  ORF Transcript_24396/g.60216 Transcript_24396/m.60216 type:complete len:352 (+) Transcript_24396:80-1135(+)|eukprot:CEM00715.1 unnamed protein product [Vitrella brassicaformis CCMP3155]
MKKSFAEEERDDVPYLRCLADRKGLLIGTAVNDWALRSGDAPYQQILQKQFNVVVAENACKWGSLRPSRSVFDFTDADRIQQLAEDNKQKFRGHCLVWHNWNGNPEWLNRFHGSAQEKQALLEEHIGTVVRHFGGKIFAWDVVNEALEDQQPAPSCPALRKSIWSDIPDFIDLAFRRAHEAAPPSTQLFYNDYNVASCRGWSKPKADAMLHLVRGMLERGVPIHGVGFQLHTNTHANTSMLMDGIRENVRRYADLGIVVHMTEVDVPGGQWDHGKFHPLPADKWTDADRATQADIYGELLKICVEEPNVKAFLSWGFTDKYTWLPEDCPLPWDRQYGEKPAVKAMRRALEA